MKAGRFHGMENSWSFVLRNDKRLEVNGSMRIAFANCLAPWTPATTTTTTTTTTTPTQSYTTSDVVTFDKVNSTLSIVAWLCVGS